MKHSLIPLIFFVFLTFQKAHGQKIMDGKYLGLENMPNLMPYKPKCKWFRMTHILIKGDSVSVYQNPIYVLKHDTLWSSSDGGFYYFKGNVSINGNQIVLNLLQTKCDYCGVRVDKTGHVSPRYKTMTGKITEKGFVIENHLFKKVETDYHWIN